MSFNSLSFAIFLPVVFALHWALPHRCRGLILLAASYYFYMSWNQKYVLLILSTTLVSYLAGLAIEKERLKSGSAPKWIAIAASFFCLGILFVFKYLGFFAQTVSAVAGMFSLTLHPVTLKLLLPVGISFYTFQTMSYVFDVYTGKTKAEHNFLIYATFISFFPQLVAGPIERTENLLPQIKTDGNGVFAYQDAVNMRLANGKEEDGTSAMLNQWVKRGHIVRQNDGRFRIIPKNDR